MHAFCRWSCQLLSTLLVSREDPVEFESVPRNICDLKPCVTPGSGPIIEMYTESRSCIASYGETNMEPERGLSVATGLFKEPPFRFHASLARWMNFSFKISSNSGKHC